jgi:RNA polymerase sigma-70 factor, ECF subfamily
VLSSNDLFFIPKTLEKERLKKKFRAGNKKAFDLIYGQYANAMYSICLRYTKNVDEAADILQDSFIRIYEKRNLFDPKYELGSWIKRIVVNEAINHYRSTKRFDLIEDEEFFDEVEQPFELTEENNIKEVLLELIRDLPPGYQAVFNMYVIDNLTHAEIAEFLGVTVNTTKTQLSKARKMLRGKLEERKITSSSMTYE